ncbi:MAG: cytochrome c [Pseudomonadales bacterium]|nr:cytochrome c [Pseudomonadales bacterium]
MKKLSFVSRLLLSVPTVYILYTPVDSAFGHSYGEWRDVQQIYASTCHYCHDTGVAPVLFGRALPPQYIAHRVRNGFNAMPAFKPSEIGVADLEALARWIEQSAVPGEGEQ